MSNKKWYLVEDANDIAYSPYRSSKRVIEYLGDGEKIPTPREVAEYLNRNPETDCEWAGLYFESRSFSETDSKEVNLPPGVYRYTEINGRHPERLVAYPIREDQGVALGSVHKQMEDRVKGFLLNEKVYRDQGILYKLGLCLYGSPGTGKTSSLRRMIKNVLPKDSLVIMISEKFPSDDFLRKINETLPNSLKVLIFEELATNLNYWHVGRLLDFLDGEMTIDRSIYIATTNYPERLPGNIVNRPSRFDEVYKFDNPEDSDREAILRFYLGREISQDEIKITEGMSIDDLKQISLLCKINSLTVAQGTAKMKKRYEVAKKAFASSPTNMGF